MNSSERRMKLILLLQQSNKRLTVNKIAEEFNISRRTVFRDFNALSEMNVPVTWDEYKGYGVIEGYKIPPLMFTSKELATILVGLNFVKSQVDQTLINDAKGVELKIKEVLPQDLLSFMETLEKRTIIDPYMNFGSEKKKGGNWFTVSNAIAENSTITFSYFSKKNQDTTERKVDPYLLVFYKDHWNIIGYSHKRKATRNFILERVSNINITEDNFIPHGKIDVKSLIFNSNEETRLIVVDIADTELDRFKANLPTKLISLKDINTNFIRVEFEFNNLPYINKWLLQFADDVEVVSPNDLKVERRKLLQKMLPN